MKWLGRLYGRRIVNVNCNVLLAGFLALVPTIWIVSLTRELGIHNMFGITAVTLVCDIVFDVVIYFVLHWLANHLPRRWGWVSSKAYQHLSFVRDATLVQFERMVMAPVLYVVALGLQMFLMHTGVGREWATAWGFVVGLTITRTMHTVWMLRAERRAWREHAAAAVLAAQGAPAGVALEAVAARAAGAADPLAPPTLQEAASVLAGGGSVKP
jgi:hypothetical protein